MSADSIKQDLLCRVKTMEKDIESLQVNVADKDVMWLLKDLMGTLDHVQTLLATLNASQDERKVVSAQMQKDHTVLARYLILKHILFNAI